MTMRITDLEVGIPDHKITDRVEDGVVLCFASMTLADGVAVRGVRLIQTKGGRLVMAWPTRHRSEPCVACRRRIPHDARYCAVCGEDQGQPDVLPVHKGEPWVEVKDWRTHFEIQRAVVEAYEAALSQTPEYLEVS